MDFRKCFVPSCQNSNVNSRKIFIAVPKNEQIRKSWCLAVGRVNILSSISGGIYCCEDHFNMELDCDNWMQFRMTNCKIRMKKNVVPHINLGNFEVCQALEGPQQDQSESCAPKKRKTEVEEPTCQEVPSLPHIADKSVQVNVKSVRDKGVQVDLKTKIKSTGVNTMVITTSVATSTSPFKMPRKILTEKNISPASSSTSSPNKSEYEKESESTDSSEIAYSQDVTTETTVKYQVKIIRENSRFFLGLPQEVYFLVSLLESKANVYYNHVLIVLKKIRLNDPYFRLGLDFGISKPQISRIINKCLPLLAAYMKQLIFWPDAHKIYTNLPIPFRYRYNKVQSIIDCLEIEIEKPTKALHQALTWSNYKKTNTLKYLISSTPDGLINFISEGFGGRITDKEIIEASTFLNILPNNCDVMADRGFKAIGSLLQKKGCNLIRPPSVETGSLSSKEDVKESKRIASLRIHIERVIRRLREFAILEGHSCIDHQLVPKTDYLIIIACGIVNLQGPLIK